MDFIKLTQNPLSVEEATNLASDASCGAVSIFIGTTRDHFEGKTVNRLEYEAYDEMAKKEMLKICEKCREKWNVKKIVVHHRLGLVNIKEASVIIAVSSEHRQESLEAVSFLIEKLKASVPIWKKEVYSDQQSEWKQNKECNWKNNKPSSCDQENFTDHFEEEKSMEDNLEFSEEETILPIPPLKDGRLNCEEHNRCFRNEKLDRNFVQIVVPRHEIERRINSFIEWKRSEANSLNNELFLMNNINNDNCARTAAHFNRSDGSKSHVTVVNVSNEYGPQTLNTCIGLSTQFSDTSPKKDLLANNDFNRSELSNGKNFSFHNLPGIEERLVNLEEHLNIRDEEVSESSIFSRINAIEKRVLFLEGLSPEYFKNINLKLFKTRGERIDYDFQNSLNVPPVRVDEYDELEEEIEYDEIDEVEEEEEYFETEEEELSEVKSVTGT